MCTNANMCTCEHTQIIHWVDLDGLKESRQRGGNRSTGLMMKARPVPIRLPQVDPYGWSLCPQLAPPLAATCP